MMKKIYIAGPMSGIAEHNFPAFDEVARLLQADGWTVVNPADHGEILGFEWADYLRLDITKLAKCTDIYFLKGWSKSKGAQLEYRIATDLGMTCHFEPGAEAAPPVAQEHIDAWCAVADALYKVSPHWLEAGSTPVEAAVQTIDMLSRQEKFLRQELKGAQDRLLSERNRIAHLMERQEQYDELYRLINPGALERPDLETFRMAIESLLDEVRGSAGTVRLTDAEVNDVTERVLGRWPSFEAQSWACKVAHAVLDYIGGPLLAVKPVRPELSSGWDASSHLSQGAQAVQAVRKLATPSKGIGDASKRLEHVAEGLANAILNADLRNDQYDVGYLRAIQKEVWELLAVLSTPSDLTGTEPDGYLEKGGNIKDGLFPKQWVLNHLDKEWVPVYVGVPGKGIAEVDIDKVLLQIFRDAIAWGFVYGPIITSEQWEEMRDRMATQFTEKVKVVFLGTPNGPESELFFEMYAELKRARQLFPGDRIMTLALCEESGELVKAVLDEPAAQVRKEAIQVAAMAMRVVLDGDGSVNEWRANKGLDALGVDRG